MSQNVHIRRANTSDVPTVARFLRAMVEEMASLGGHPVARDDEAWTQIKHAISQELENGDHLCLLAEVPESGPDPGIAIGLVEARAMAMAPVFRPTPMLHIHALYVVDAYRREGIGQALLDAALAWGRDKGCTEVELNVLVNNPARVLYEKMGFQALQVEMVRRL